MNILINCSNLQGGGGVSVASSFIDCLSKESLKDFKITLLLSEKVYKNLLGLKVQFNKFDNVIVKNIFGIRSLFTNYRKFNKDMTLMFTVFGPIYILRRDFIHISGLAQPYVIYPNNAYVQTLSGLKKIKVFLRTIFQTFFTLNNDVLIVERFMIQKRLMGNNLFKNIEIFVVPSTIHSLYYDKNSWGNLEIYSDMKKLRIGLIARNYPHKNLQILPKVKNDLLNIYDIKSEFYVTLSDDEWNKTSNIFKKSVINLGTLRLDQCPLFYKNMDLILMPTLLESFSSIPIESMIMEKPFFGSNLDFMKDVCGNYCIYIDPFNSKDIASNINLFINQSYQKKKKWINKAKNYANQLPDAYERCNQYMNIIKKKINKNKSTY